MGSTDIMDMIQSGKSPDWFFIRKELINKAKSEQPLELEELIALRACDAIIDNDRHSARIVARKAAEIPYNQSEKYPTDKNKVLHDIKKAMETSLKLKRRR
jgi:hypothetical protein